MTLAFQPKRDAGFMPEPLTTPPTRSASRRRFTQRKAPFHPSITKLQSDRLLGATLFESPQLSNSAQAAAHRLAQKFQPLVKLGGSCIWMPGKIWKLGAPV